MSDLLTIGEAEFVKVARAADVATSALRSYEAEGLVMPVGRSATDSTILSRSPGCGSSGIRSGSA